MKILILLAGLGLVKAIPFHHVFEDTFDYRPIFRHRINKVLPNSQYNCSYCQPEQIHIAFGEKLNDIVVTWSTDEDSQESRVQYGESTMDMEATGNCTQFIQGRGQFIHRVTMKDLKYDTKYVYHCGSKFGWSERFEFKTPRAENNATVRAIIFGDLGVENAQSLPYIQDESERDSYDFIMHVGDFAYDMFEDLGRLGDQFMRQIQPIAAIKPYMVVPGNHEYHGHIVGGVEHYTARFSMPIYEKQKSKYYSWNIGPVHFVGVNTESWWYESWDDLAHQFAWLIKDLEEASKPENRKLRPWIILYGHRPMYCSDTHDYLNCRNSRLRVGFGKAAYAMEPLLKIYGVDIAIWAHEHSYERTWPVFDTKVHNGSFAHPYINPRAPVHVITGSAGCRERTDTFIENPEKWSAFRSSDYGYTRFQAYNHTHVHFEQVSVDKNGTVIDSFWVVKEVHAPYDHL